MFAIFLTLVHVFISLAATVISTRCESYFKGCCPGTAWNYGNNTCEPCMDGYQGENCSLTCPYPYFGKECQMKCNCTKDLCDISSGCLIDTTVKEEKEENFDQTTFVAEDNNAVNAISKSTIQNHILRMLIIVFGCIDLLLIFVYSVLCVKDRQRGNTRRFRTHEIAARTNSTYENIEIRFL